MHFSAQAWKNKNISPQKIPHISENVLTPKFILFLEMDPALFPKTSYIFS